MKPWLPLVKFLALNAAAAALALVFLFSTADKRGFSNWETQTNLPLIPRNCRFPLLLMGASHGRAFSEMGNHQRVEQALGMPMLNLSQGRGGGIRSMDLYLSYFYRRGNRADRLLYMIHPFALGSPVFNEFHSRLQEEPFRPDFLAELIRDRYPAASIAAYLQKKFSPAWIRRGLADTTSAERDVRWVGGVASDSIAVRDANMYPDGFSPARFERYSPYLEHMLALAESHGTRIILVFPPTLLGPQRGMEELKGFLEAEKGRHRFAFRDWHAALQDPRLFRDLDHLNSAGVDYFARAFIKPLLDSAMLPFR